MIAEIVTDLKNKFPEELVDVLLNSYEEVKQNFFLGRHEPSELNGGKFCEACIRILQYETNGGIYTPIGSTVHDMIGKLRDFERLSSSSHNDSYRIHIPRVLIAIYNIRNRRGVGHLGGDVNPNYTDACLISSCSDWIMAELFKLHYSCTLDKAQEIVDALVQPQLNLVHEFNEIRRVLLPSLSLKDQTLVLLSESISEKTQVSDLINWIEPSNKSYYRTRILKSLHSQRYIEYSDEEWCIILPPGIRYVSSKYPIWVKLLNRGE